MLFATYLNSLHLSSHQLNSKNKLVLFLLFAFSTQYLGNETVSFRLLQGMNMD